MGGILVMVGNSTRLLEAMTKESAVAQRQTDNLSNAQREILRLIQAVGHLTDKSDPTVANPNIIVFRLALFNRQWDVSKAGLPAGAEAAEGQDIGARVNGLDWAGIRTGNPESQLIRAVVATLAEVEKAIKVLYDAQAQRFYGITTQSLHVKEQGQTSLAAMGVLVAILGFGWVVILRKRNRSDLRHAYDALLTEMHDRRAAEEAVAVSERRFRSLVQRASDLTGITDENGLPTYISPAVESLFGYTPEEFISRPLSERVHPDDQQALAHTIELLGTDPNRTATVEFRIQASDGRWRHIEAVGRNLLEDSTIKGIVWNGRDVTDRRLLQDELTHQAFHDALTSLPNRALLLERLDDALVARRGTGAVSVVLIDLDGFKGVNDTLGHQAGDELLRQVAGRLTRCLRVGDTAARLGGDEFAVIVDGVQRDEPMAVADRILTAMREPVTVHGSTVFVGASIGVAAAEPQCTATDLLRDADIAMYAAKSAGKNRVIAFEAPMRDDTTKRSTLVQELTRAVERHQIQVAYQPIVDLNTGRILAMEALARWPHPERGMVDPDEFIPIAEQGGQIVELGRQVLVEACAAAARWRRDLPEHRNLGINVNVSGRQAAFGDLAAQVVRALDATGLDPVALTLEITESVLLDDSEAVRGQFAEIRELGVHIAVDDFGAGYSSIGSLLRFSADVLKIDRSFLEFDTASQGSLVQAVSGLGRTLNLLVVAEGVETLEQWKQARLAGCHAAQGFWFSHPTDETTTSVLLRRSATAQWGDESSRTAIDAGGISAA